MVRHIVLTRFLPDTSEALIATIYAGLQGLVEAMPEAQNFVGGRSTSPENIERGYQHGFTIDFDSWDALKDYADNADHQALGAQLVSNAVGGLEGILVLDIEV